MNDEADASWSSISGKAFIAEPDAMEHPVAVGARAEVHRETTVGRFSFINIGTVIYRNVTVGRFCSIARNCEIGLASHPFTTLSTHSFQYTNAAFPNVPDYGVPNKLEHQEHPETTIGSDVWIGAQVVVKAGVSIGHGAVIGANATVLSDVPPYAIVAGTPGEVLRMRFDEDTVEGLLLTHWWDLPFEQTRNLPFQDVKQCLAILRELRSTEEKA
jgi:Acetyltransferase (isoleucine patch superfamily)